MYLQKSPDAGPSFGKFLLDRETDFGLSEAEMAFLAGGFFTAGSDTVGYYTITICQRCSLCHSDSAFDM
jgi:hypothetical protein